MEDITTTEQTIETGKEEVVVETPAEESIDSDNAKNTTESEDQTTGSEEDQAQAEEKKKQTEAENAEFARKRREAERKAEIEKVKEETRISTIIEAVGVNPYTKEPLSDVQDVKIYEAMREYEKKGGDPVADQAKILKSILSQEHETEKAKQDKLESSKTESEKAQKEISELEQTYPNINVKALLENEQFSDYAEGKVGKKTLKEMYEGFKKLTNNFSFEKTKNNEAKNNASNISLKGSQPAPKGLLSMEQIKRMSQSEIDKNWDIVQKSLHFK